MKAPELVLPINNPNGNDVSPSVGSRKPVVFCLGIAFCSDEPKAESLE